MGSKDQAQKADIPETEREKRQRQSFKDRFDAFLDKNMKQQEEIDRKRKRANE